MGRMLSRITAGAGRAYPKASADCSRVIFFTDTAPPHTKRRLSEAEAPEYSSLSQHFW